MIHYTSGNLLEADTEALVNTVNTVGVMGKGIALMFKDRFPDIFNAYKTACDRNEVLTGKMFVTQTGQLHNPKWVIHFPTKKHWRPPSKIEWIDQGLADLRQVILDLNIKSIGIPPLGSGNGKLDWADVRPLIEQHLSDLQNVRILVYEPSQAYRNVSKTTGLEELTPPRAMIAEMIRRYEILGLDCSILEIQKLAWVLNRVINQMGLKNPLKLDFTAQKYGPYSNNLRHLLDKLDGSYLHCEKRLADSTPLDTIHFAPSHDQKLRAFLQGGEKKHWVEAIDAADAFIDGFQSPLGMEALATVGWLIDAEKCEPTLQSIREGIAHWPYSADAAQRKQAMFSDKLLLAAIRRY
ncbi:type II toxin-antitoxin system antitoxin DNA ADP-ribosyl glycohydrolase DarG [Mucisphaera calidilacus]|uniref:RNase III inhibitor n=1 Tax=Mucisphaera calidilacus TaxID=2527982 RepID=A0A518C186_9BACT|nr:macro domain-containing protein [Mucisphaera calidilacus]QDU72996.1 RNase III inhibitor [Mucisphaera calidilacus]